VKKHYATEAQKLKDKMKENFGQEKKKKKKKKRQFVYSFNMMDIKTRMYLGYGTSFKSEKEAFHKATKMVKKTGVKINSLRLDKYYSNKGDAKLCQELFGNIKMYLLPKSNATVGGFEWNKMLTRLTNNVKEYLKEYYKRNQSESGFSEDKKRISQKLEQKRDDRIDTANFLTLLWHNLYWLE